MQIYSFWSAVYSS